ncbi:hypothetical protein BHE74_00028010 [Ensete ventricosum]|nr:hypothetical protein GW17_00052516 [Ensete ventricosum]RWW64731.1 hypothetical protein BHE74_00028010 [Ensete ventricosum]RZR98907.1 hypothetical protein BHM03_00028353 [Ensete ventricosum]
MPSPRKDLPIQCRRSVSLILNNSCDAIRPLPSRGKLSMRLSRTTDLDFPEDQVSHADWFSLRPAYDASGVKFSILKVGKTTLGGKMVLVPKARL